MKKMIPSLVVLLSVAAPAMSQESQGSLLSGRVEESTVPTRVDSRPLASIEPEPHHACRLRRLGHGLREAMRFTGRAAEQALQAAVVAAANGAAAYYAASVPTYGAYVSSYSSVAAATNMGDSCYHGYTYATCPYGYYGDSYGTTYISGAGSTRLQSDYLGGYRFYNYSSGSAGVARPDMMGGYRVSAMSGPRTYSLYTASHVPGGYRRW